MKPSRTLLMLDEAADALGITLLDLLDYAKQGLLEVVINSDQLLVEIMATRNLDPKTKKAVTLTDLQYPLLKRKGMMMNPLIMQEGPAGEIVLFGGFRAVNEGTLETAFEKAAAGQKDFETYYIYGFKPTDEDIEIMAKVLGCEKQDVWLNISIDHERLDEIGIEKPLTFYVKNNELERFRNELVENSTKKLLKPKLYYDKPIRRNPGPLDELDELLVRIINNAMNRESQKVWNSIKSELRKEKIQNRKFDTESILLQWKDEKRDTFYWRHLNAAGGKKEMSCSYRSLKNRITKLAKIGVIQ